MSSSSQVPMPGAVVVDANIAVAISSKEAGRDVLAVTQLNVYAAHGYEWFAPGAIITETLYALCQNYQTGQLSVIEHDAAVSAFEVLMETIQPPPGGETSVVRRSYEIRDSYGSSRSADAVYIALAEELTKTRQRVFLMFDQRAPKQSGKNVQTVTVPLLTI